MQRLDPTRSDPSSQAVARAVGNLAGVVEWANEAFACLSGVPLEETLDKPVARLLERAGIGLDVVELVAQQFFEGEVCRVAFPFERPDGRRIDVVLDVTALRNDQGEVDRFLAEAREPSGPPPAASSDPSKAATTPSPATPAAWSRSPSPTTSPTTSPTASPTPSRATSTAWSNPPASAIEAPAPSCCGASPIIDVSVVIAEWLAARPPARAEERTSGRASERRSDGPAAVLEVDLARELPPIAGREESLRQLLSSLSRAALQAVANAENAGAVLTLSARVAEPFRRIHSPVHPIASGPPEPIDMRCVVVELHDTGLPLPAETLERLRQAEAAREDGPGRGPLDEASAAPTPSREALLMQAVRATRSLGGRLRFESTAGCGNQALALFPARAPARAPAGALER